MVLAEPKCRSDERLTVTDRLRAGMRVQVQVSEIPTIFLLAEGMSLQDLLLPMGVALIVVSVMLSMRKRRKSSANTLTPDEEVERNRQLKGMRGDLEELMVDIEELARRFSAQMDAKAMRLEKLIDEADAKLAELDRRLGKTGGAGEEGARPGATMRVREPYEAETGGDDGARPARQGGGSDDPVAKRVYQLADRGMSPQDIARTLDEHVGKVELMLALRQ